MSNIQDIIISAGLAAARPAAGSEGRLYYSTDTQVLERDTGVGWETYASSGGAAADEYYGGNLVKNSPGQIVVDGAEPQWWDDVGSAAITDEDTAGEAPPDIHERCFKVVTILDDVYGYQTFTLADEETLDAGVTVVSFGCWVYCATGAKASIGIYGTNLTLQESSQAGAGAWEWLSIEDITLDAGDASIEIRLIVDSTTAWFTMPMFAVGPAAQPWRPRDWKMLEVFDTLVASGPHTETLAWTNVDATAVLGNLAVAVQHNIRMSNLNTNKDWFVYIRPGYSGTGTVAGSAALRRNVNAASDYCVTEGMTLLDDGNTFDYYTDNLTDATTLAEFYISTRHFWKWA